MASKRPLISIGMPVRNAGATVGLAIRSLLAQTLGDWELLVFDDGSRDETLREVEQFRDSRICLHVDGRNLGLAARLNQSIAMSRGRYFARMDGDDAVYPQRLERQVAYLEANRHVDLAGTWAVVFAGDGVLLGKRTGPEDHENICARPFAGFPLAHPTYMGRTEWFRRFKYDEKLPKSQDQDLLMRSYRFSRFANVPEILLAYREERIHLRKLLVGRYYLARSLVREFSRQKRHDLAVRGVLEQGIKAGVDCLATGTGLNYRLLRHRARPVTPADRQGWERIWRDLVGWPAGKGF